MSEVLLNGKVEALSIPKGIPVNEIIDNHLSDLIPQNQIVCDVQIDNRAMYSNSACWGEFQRLEVKTAHPFYLVKEGLDESCSVMQEISDNMKECADLLREGNATFFRPKFTSSIDSLLEFLRFLGLTQSFIGIKESVMEQFQQNLKLQVEQLLLAQQKGDTVLLADLLEFEMIPLFEGWPGIRNILLDSLSFEDVDK
jgi:hypothetical protein